MPKNNEIPPKKSSVERKRRLPRTPGGFSINFCRNPHCELYGEMPNPFDGRGRGIQGNGRVVGSGEDRTYVCPSCGKYHIVKSNTGILEEYARLRKTFGNLHFPSCQNLACQNHGVPIHLAKLAYAKFGKTASGDPRYRCNTCRQTFSVGAPTRRHKKTHETGSILKNLVNKVPLSRMCEINNVNFQHIYSKIDFIEQQCLKFGNRREVDLADCFSGTSPFFATDAQVIHVNWQVRSRRGSVPMIHTATVHQGSQYVVSSTMDYDPDVQPEDLDEWMAVNGDFTLPRSMRKQARLWSHREYAESVARYNNDIISEDDLMVGGDLQLPGVGSRVRTDIAAYAHLMQVKKRVGKWYRSATYCLDMDSVLGAAASAIWVDDIKKHSVNIAQIDFQKNLTSDQKQALSRQGKAKHRQMLDELSVEVAAILGQNSDLTSTEALVAVLLERLEDSLDQEERGKRLMEDGMPWPFHTQGEPNKKIKLWTDFGQHTRVELAQILCRASIHPVDAYFAVVRRRVAGFDRGLQTGSNRRRTWYAYAFYDPNMVVKIINILRFYYNYMVAGSDGRTPAMRLGLARGVIYERDLFSLV
ncbi:hypothetical protein [Celeribacter sp.]|uniref:hypothetical protein n=1 Tax=Celeribacter sp. TaxID=1890673 RepID=UPI003A91691F